MSEVSVNIRTIQHFMYCKRRWGLLEINNDWSENSFVVKANILHENVHSGTHSFSDRNKVVKSSLSLYNDNEEYNIYGVADCIEFIKDRAGVTIGELPDLYSVNIVEYKPAKPSVGEYNETDAIQVFAQKICADSIWKCNSKCFIYYADTKKRVKLPFDEKSIYEKYDEILKKLIGEMRMFISENKIPEKQKGQKCSGCSMKELCFPKSIKYSVKGEIDKLRKEGII